MHSKADRRLIETVKVIEKHLEKNEKWFQYPEKKMNELDAEIQNWDKEFLQGMAKFEEVMVEIEKIME
ncbi:hypothetical protein [Lentibacillus sp. CBA3610]|uniref:hypothetical protein n=1 Tax=Lentibacillus sp. CBA3610 TaxID=2518176 RepID=UPI0015950158|nr:hypothetical protein [Lentibacillus sp. CBA3610]QKY68627.1 hypothetical protein Len3610_02410 [Lentibacillus sp. CBA3610]